MIAGRSSCCCAQRRHVIAPPGERGLPTPPDLTTPGLTTCDLAKRYRVSQEKIRSWIASGQLHAVNTSEPLARPRWVVPVEALAEFERRRAGGPAPKTVRRKKASRGVDFYPDSAE